MTDMPASLSAAGDRYAALGRLLAAAGVPPARTEQLIADALADDARATRDVVSQDIRTLVEAFLARLEQRHRHQTDDASRLMTRITIELEVSKRHARDMRSTRNRLIIALLLLQFLGTVVIAIALVTGGAFTRTGATDVPANPSATLCQYEGG
ncbi:hypothetical protein [Sphingobium yanoikuyae]|uniref:hypothetical protein n=1 Tax=Sphingobium yanoikuyae TaxID=13690 RepID=UPI0012D35CFA|nr:hypothetical protein [Sphingobium yanoikuyae]